MHLPEMQGRYQAATDYAGYYDQHHEDKTRDTGDRMPDPPRLFAQEYCLKHSPGNYPDEKEKVRQRGVKCCPAEESLWDAAAYYRHDTSDYGDPVFMLYATAGLSKRAGSGEGILHIYDCARIENYPHFGKMPTVDR